MSVFLLVVAQELLLLVFALDPLISNAARIMSVQHLKEMEHANRQVHALELLFLGIVMDPLMFNVVLHLLLLVRPHKVLELVNLLTLALELLMQDIVLEHQISNVASKQEQLLNLD